MDPHALSCLRAMGVQVWTERRPASDSPADPAAALPAARGLPGQLPGWAELEARVEACTLCGLHRTRRRAVFGTGRRDADWMLIGEAPGAEEDRRGEPFVGRAGQLLNEMLAAIGLDRESVYIANVLKSRPPENRDPLPDEVAACEPYLQAQVALVRPRVILALGRIAAQNLLKTDQRIGALRGRTHRYGESGIPLVVTYHPAYLLRTPSEKRKAWDDLCLAARLAAGVA